MRGRTIDIDILWSLEGTFQSNHFFIPHKQALMRNFFVVPAIESLKSARWPLPINLSGRIENFGCNYLEPVTSHHSDD